MFFKSFPPFHVLCSYLHGYYSLRFFRKHGYTMDYLLKHKTTNVPKLLKNGHLQSPRIPLLSSRQLTPTLHNNYHISNFLSSPHISTSPSCSITKIASLYRKIETLERNSLLLFIQSMQTWALLQILPCPLPFPRANATYSPFFLANICQLPPIN